MESLDDIEPRPLPEDESAAMDSPEPMATADPVGESSSLEPQPLGEQRHADAVPELGSLGGERQGDSPASPRSLVDSDDHAESTIPDVPPLQSQRHVDSRVRQVRLGTGGARDESPLPDVQLPAVRNEPSPSASVENMEWTEDKITEPLPMERAQNRSSGPNELHDLLVAIERRLAAIEQAFQEKLGYQQ